MPEYLVEPFDTPPAGLKSMQAFINEKTAEGHALHQAVPESTYGGTDFLAQLRAMTNDMCVKAEVLLDGS